MLKIFNYFFQSIFIYLFFFIGLILGLRISRKLFSSLFSLIGPFIKSQKVINENLNIFLNNGINLEREKTINEMWKNYGMTFIEYIFLNRFRKKSSHITIKGKEKLLKIIPSGQPVIFISGHFANFELMSMEITKLNIPLATIYRPLNNFFLNFFMEYLRKKYICKNQIKKGIHGVRDTIEYLNKNYSIALMIDQRVSEGEKIDFFGKQALTTTLPAQLSKKYGLYIIPVFIKRDKSNNFEIEFQDKVDPADYKNKLELTEKLNKILEKMIIRNPSQWIWTHNRWK